MECRPLEITIVSASDLKDDNIFPKMDVYAAVSISGDPRNKEQKTTIAKDGGTNPKWNSNSNKFTLDDAALLHNRLTLNIELSLGDTKIGGVQIPLKELFDSMDSSDDQKKQIKHVSYSVPTSSGKTKGSINFGYKFGDKFTVPVPEAHKKTNELVMAYPSGHPGSSSRDLHAGHAGPYPPAQAYLHPTPGGYPPPSHQQLGYGHAPQHHQQSGYGYAPRPGYGYALQHHQQSGYGYAPRPHLQPGNGYAPQHHQQSGYGYAPRPHQQHHHQQSGYGYAPGPHQQPVYGYAPQHHQPPVYGYAPPPLAGGYPPQPGYGRGGGNMALAVEAGLCGGLVIGDVGEMAAYDDGYDAGFGGDDFGGGFDGYDAGFGGVDFGGGFDGYDAGFGGVDFGGGFDGYDAGFGGDDFGGGFDGYDAGFGGDDFGRGYDF